MVINLKKQNHNQTDAKLQTSCTNGSPREDEKSISIVGTTLYNFLLLLWLLFINIIIIIIIIIINLRSNIYL